MMKHLLDINSAPVHLLWSFVVCISASAALRFLPDLNGGNCIVPWTDRRRSQAGYRTPCFVSQAHLDHKHLDDDRPSKHLAKSRLLSLIEKTPRNSPTSALLTQEILSSVREVEAQCPTRDEDVLSELGGNWDLLWTAQDRNSKEWKDGSLISNWINPVENQSYSNNPSGPGAGRANPILPREIQDKLEEFGLITTSNGFDEDSSSSPFSSPVRSSQLIDMKNGRVRNVVGIVVPSPASFLPLDSLGGKRGGKVTRNDRSRLRGFLTVDIAFAPAPDDMRKINVKFESCRVKFLGTLVDVVIPLGFVGPTGWLRTGYIDDTIRITRGHKGSVFVLSRASQ